jgi:hypothetical protein
MRQFNTVLQYRIKYITIFFLYNEKYKVEPVQIAFHIYRNKENIPVKVYKAYYPFKLFSCTHRSYIKYAFQLHKCDIFQCL